MENRETNHRSDTVFESIRNIDSSRPNKTVGNSTLNVPKHIFDKGNTSAIPHMKNECSTPKTVNIGKGTILENSGKTPDCHKTSDLAETNGKNLRNGSGPVTRKNTAISPEGDTNTESILGESIIPIASSFLSFLNG